jgi:hypothetical protein
VQVVDTGVVSPDAADAAMDSMMSSTWIARSAAALGFLPERRARAMSRAPMPRPSALPSAGILTQSVSAGISSHSLGSTLLTSFLHRNTDPSKVFGSGRRMTASVPCASSSRKAIGASKLNVTVAIGPETNSSSAKTWVSMVTVEDLSCAWAAANDALVLRSAAEAGDGLDRAEHLDQRGQVVRTHVEQRTSALLEEELRAGVPGVRAGVAEGGLG